MCSYHDQFQNIFIVPTKKPQTHYGHSPSPHPRKQKLLPASADFCVLNLASEHSIQGQVLPWDTLGPGSRSLPVPPPLNNAVNAGTLKPQGSVHSPLDASNSQPAQLLRPYRFMADPSTSFQDFQSGPVFPPESVSSYCPAVH